ncbi:MAG: response regulator [Chitinophagaceae bacterium]|nr:response regulator [Chitinophagaceae bacterium]
MLVKIPSQNSKVIVCDDDPDILDAIVRLLELEGLTAIGVRNSAQLYQEIDEHRPDLLIVDLWMPQFNGEDIIRHIKSHPERSKMAILLISASMIGDRVGAQAGADAFLAKPFEMEELIAISKSLIQAGKQHDNRKVKAGN